MRRWQEEELLTKICNVSDEQRERIYRVLADIKEEELCDELNLMLCKSAVLERKAKKRLDQELRRTYEKDPAEDDRKCLKETVRQNAKICKTSQFPVWSGQVMDIEKQSHTDSDRKILEYEIPICQAETDQIKYTLHQNRNAGIFASEMAKEWIDLQECAIRKLNRYLQEPETEDFKTEDFED